MARSRGRPAGAETEGRDHQPGVAEHRLRLLQPQALDAADQPVGVDVDVVEVDRGGVGGADAVLVLGLAPGDALGFALDHEPARAAGRHRQKGVEIGIAAVADPLFGTGQPVADDLAVLGDRLGGRLERTEVRAGFRLGGAVGHQQPFERHPRHPVLLLCRRAAEDDRVRAEEGGEDAGGDAEIDLCHLLAHPVDVERAAAHALEVLGDEQQLNAQAVAAHRAHDFDRELVGMVELQQLVVGQVVRGELAHGFQRQVQ